MAETVSTSKPSKKKLILLILVAGFPCLLVALRLLGILIPYSIPTDGMSPAASKNDMLLVEGFTFLRRQPARGDIVAFKTDGIKAIVPPPGVKSQIYLKRLAGLPGETLQISQGKIYVNGTPAPIFNQAGEIHYTNPRGSGGLLSSAEEKVTVPAGMYFVLGDNSPDSADSRYWGFVPAGNVIGKVSFRFGPLNRIGAIQ